VSRQSERIYAARALHAGAAGYWMKNGSAEELLRAVEAVQAGKFMLAHSSPREPVKAMCQDAAILLPITPNTCAETHRDELAGLEGRSSVNTKFA